MTSVHRALPASSVAEAAVARRFLRSAVEPDGQTGRSATIRNDMANLEAIGLNDAVSSLQVGPGEQWEVCERAAISPQVRFRT